jgi:uncharacterized membrane protein
MSNEPSGSQGSELDPKLSAMLAYLLGIIGGIVFYSISKDSFVKFHAMQSIFYFIAVAVFYVIFWVLGFIIPFLFFLTWLVGLAITAVWIILMVKAYGGERFKLPVIGDMAEKYAK